MKILLLLLSILVALPASADQWMTYRNYRYGYELQHPDSYEVVITGRETERDGRTIRICMKNTARFHGLDVQIHPGMSMDKIMAKQNIAPTLSELERGTVTTNSTLHRISWEKTMANNAEVLKMSARFNENGESFLISIIMDQVVFSLNLWPEAGFDEKVAGSIVATFKWMKGTHNLPNAGVRK